MEPFAITLKIIRCSVLLIFIITGSVDSRPLRQLGVMTENSVVCLIEEQCRRKFRELNLNYLYVNNWPTKGCFLKGNNAYFGIGGTVEEMSDTDLPGIQERIWCDRETEKPTAKPSKRPTAIPTAKPVTDSPTAQPTRRPVTSSPTMNPTSKPVTDSPTMQPTRKPVTDRPTEYPTPKPVTDSPTKNPTSKPVTENPIKQPSLKPVIDSPVERTTTNSATDSPIGSPAELTSNQVTDSLTKPPTTNMIAKPDADSPTAVSPNLVTNTPLIAHTSMPVTDSPARQPVTEPDTDSPTNQPSANPITDSPSKQPFANPTTDSPSRQPSANPVTDSPSKQPSANPVTDIPSKQPTANPVTDSPSCQPTANPVTGGPTTHPTVKPVTDSPTNKPSENPVTDSPTMQPTVSPVTNGPTMQPSASPVTDGPTMQPSAKPLTDSPTEQPTAKPLTDSPTAQPTAKPATDSPTEQPTAKPVTDSPTDQPTAKPVTDSPTEQSTAKPLTGSIESPTEQPSEPPTDEPSLKPISTAKPSDTSRLIVFTPVPSTVLVSTTEEDEDDSQSSRHTVSISPFILTLQTDPQTTAIASEELTYLVSNHLLKEMQSNFPHAQVTAVNVDVLPVPSQRRRRQQEGLAFASDNVDHVISEEHAFVVEGEACFASALPTTEELNAVTQKVFQGESGNEFVHSLQNAEDAGLRSTRSFSVSEPPNSNRSVEPVENYLNTPDEDPVVSNRVYVMSIVFGVGFVLVALYVFKTRRGRKIELESKQNLVECNDEESAAVHVLPRYIDIAVDNNATNKKCVEDDCESQYDGPCSLYGSIREALTGQDESSQDSQKGSLSIAKNSDIAMSPQTQPPSDNHASGSHVLSAVTTTSGEVQPATRSPEVELNNVRDGDDRSRSSTSQNTASSEKLSVFPSDLPSISEASDKNQEENDEWNPCGGYPTPVSNKNKMPTGSEVSERPSTKFTTEESTQVQDCSFCGVGDIATGEAEKRVAGGMWGHSPSEFSLEYSQTYQASEYNRTMQASQTTGDDAHTASTFGTWGQMADDLVSLGSQSTETSKMRNVSS